MNFVKAFSYHLCSGQEWLHFIKNNNTVFAPTILSNDVHLPSAADWQFGAEKMPHRLHRPLSLKQEQVIVFMPNSQNCVKTETWDLTSCFILSLRSSYFCVLFVWIPLTHTTALSCTDRVCHLSYDLIHWLKYFYPKSSRWLEDFFCWLHHVRCTPDNAVRSKNPKVVADAQTTIHGNNHVQVLSCVHPESHSL